jgi:vacuolar protein sorting-associated protein 16
LTSTTDTCGCRAWCIGAQIKTSTDSDTELAKKLVDKLQAVPRVSYAECSTAAYNFGRTGLAIILLDHEARAIDQVPLLISMKQEDLALQKAVHSGDTDLGMLVVDAALRSPMY